MVDIKRTMAAGNKDGDSMDLLRNRLIGGLFRARWFPVAVQVVMLAVFVLLILGGLGVTTSDTDLTWYLRDTNLANLIVWSYWWPVIIITAVLLGRLWCAVCPMEFLTYWAGRIGLGRRVPRLLRSGWAVTIFYTLVWIVGIQTLAINRVPHQMALYMLLLIIVAVDVSLIFEKRAFCSYICPVGHLLGLYALLSPFEWRSSDTSICQSCKTKDCVSKKNRHRLVGRSCTSNLYPAAIADNRKCLLCTQCVKACPHGNLRFSVRRPLADLRDGLELRSAQIGFILMLGGFVVYEILSEWQVSLDILTWVPTHLTQALGLTGTIDSLVSATLLFAVAPVLALLVVVALGRLASVRQRVPLGTIAGTLTLLMLPTIAGAHITKSVLKMSSRLPYWRGVVSDPRGIETAQSLAAGTVELDVSAVEALDPAVTVAAVALLLLSLVATVVVFRRTALARLHGRGVKVVLLLSALAYWGVFALTIVRWRL